MGAQGDMILAGNNGGRRRQEAVLHLADSAWHRAIGKRHHRELIREGDDPGRPRRVGPCGGELASMAGRVPPQIQAAAKRDFGTKTLIKGRP